MLDDNVIEEARQQAERRKYIKEQYRKAYLNPFKTKHTIVDPALVRYDAARSYAREYYKFTPRSLLTPMIIFGVFYATYKYVYAEKMEEKRKQLSGELTYADRALYKTKYLF